MKVFLFMCRVGLCYTLGRALGNWFADGLLTVLRGAWYTVCLSVCSKPKPLGSRLRQTFPRFEQTIVANTFHVWTCDLSPHPFHQITVFSLNLLTHQKNLLCPAFAMDRERAYRQERDRDIERDMDRLIL